MLKLPGQVPISAECMLKFRMLNMCVMERHDRIARAIQLSGKKKGEIAKECGIAPSAVTQWIDGSVKSMKPENLFALAKATGFSAHWLATEDGPERLESNVEPGPDTKGLIPLISWVQAGSWSEVVDLYAVGDAEDWLPCPASHGSRCFALRVRGESMFDPHGRRSFREGDIVYVDPDRQHENGSLVIAKLTDSQEATFKQLVTEDEKRYLKALNPAWPERMMPINDNCHIVGVVFSKVELF